MSFAGSIASTAVDSSMWPGSGSWTSRPSTRVVGVQLGEQLQQLGLRRVRGQPDVARVDADRLGRLLLEADVDLRGGVVSDEHRREADVAELGDLERDFGANLRRQRLAVDDLCRHASEVIAWAA